MIKALIFSLSLATAGIYWAMDLSRDAPPASTGCFA
jgi:hypothetical protein